MTGEKRGTDCQEEREVILVILLKKPHNLHFSQQNKAHLL